VGTLKIDHPKSRQVFAKKTRVSLLEHRVQEVLSPDTPENVPGFRWSAVAVDHPPCGKCCCRYRIVGLVPSGSCPASISVAAALVADTTAGSVGKGVIASG
jgi:hypothetical protein